MPILRLVTTKIRVCELRIDVQDLTRCYRDADRNLSVISGLHYHFPEKGSVAVIGRSGVGKSTFLHLLAGLDKPSQGEVLYDGQSLDELSSDERAAFRAKHIGFIFQFHHLLPEFSAAENVAMPLLIGGVSADLAKTKSHEMLNKVGLAARIQHRPGELSGGEQQRVAIARALVSRPDVVLADEPTGNLDHQTAGEIQNLLLSMNRELQNVLIVVTHSRELAETMDVVLEMQPGGGLITV